MSKLAEIRERANYDATNLIEVDQISFARIEQDRAHILDLVTRMRAVLVEVVGAGIELDDARMDYVLLQIDRMTLAATIALLAETGEEGA